MRWEENLGGECHGIQEVDCSPGQVFSSEVHSKYFFVGHTRWCQVVEGPWGNHWTGQVRGLDYSENWKMAVDLDFIGQRSKCEVEKSGGHESNMDPYKYLVV